MTLLGKRVIAPFLLFAVISLLLIFRITEICLKVDKEAVVDPSARTFEIADSRGMIYDRNGLPLVYSERKTVLAVDPTEKAIEELQKYMDYESFGKIYPSLLKGKPLIVQCGDYEGDCSDIIRLDISERSLKEDVAAHIVGYVDGSGDGKYGIEKAFDEYLKKYSGSLSVRFKTDISGAVIAGAQAQIIDKNYLSKGGVMLTLDKRIQAICENAMVAGGIDKGAVVVLKADTSEILAVASFPVFDRNDMSASVESDDSPFLNRAFCAYPVGSVFKPVVASAALMNNVDMNFFVDCKGSVNVGTRSFGCHKRSGHGKLKIDEAMAVSCNCFFIELGLKTGRENILNTAAMLGFGSGTVLADGMSSSSGVLPAVDDIDSPQSLANLSFGQGQLTATPLQIAALYCAFANGGYYREPYLLKNLIDDNGDIVAYYKNEVDNKVLDEDVCRNICSMLSLTVESGLGASAKPEYTSAAGKTATAQTGVFENGDEILHTWFAGFFPVEKPEYAVVIFKENGTSASADCAPVFKLIADEIISLK